MTSSSTFGHPAVFCEGKVQWFPDKIPSSYQTPPLGILASYSGSLSHSYNQNHFLKKKSSSWETKILWYTSKRFNMKRFDFWEKTWILNHKFYINSAIDNTFYLVYHAYLNPSVSRASIPHLISRQCNRSRGQSHAQVSPVRTFRNGLGHCWSQLANEMNEIKLK